ncbi:GcrA family cell cycle regulator [Mesorhizobium sp. CAU 1732]|uniref:GcrA family cell cycle regulator n=1 Tax=Mesorhizobium sp. CAU 1732 TaxID=3140358 RepID=UPI00325FE29C
MNWTDERVEMLKKLWSEGLSASQIATQLGGVSRNAVIGKVHRLKLSARGRTSSAQPRVKKTVTTTTVKATVRPTRPVTMTVGANALATQFDAEPIARQVMRPQENVVIPISRKLTLIQLTERTCKWPNGDPLSEEFNFCGNEAGENGPYCGYHSKVAYQPVSERRRAR